MSEFLSEDKEREIITEGGMSKEDYNDTIGKIDQRKLDMNVFRGIWGMATNEPTDVKEVKARKIRENIELEKKKAQQTAVTKTYIRWVIIYDKVAASRRFMEVEVDEGATANFLTHGMAADRRLQVQSLESEPFRGDAINSDVVCYDYAKVPLFDGNQDKLQHPEAVFHILPAEAPPHDPRIDKPIIGRHFLREFGHLLLTEDPRDIVRPTKMGKETELMKEQRKEQVKNLENYEANARRKRDETRKTKSDRDKEAENKGSSSSTGDKQGN